MLCFNIGDVMRQTLYTLKEIGVANFYYIWIHEKTSEDKEWMEDTKSKTAVDNAVTTRLFMPNIAELGDRLDTHRTREMTSRNFDLRFSNKPQMPSLLLGQKMQKTIVATIFFFIHPWATKFQKHENLL